MIQVEYVPYGRPKKRLVMPVLCDVKTLLFMT